MSNLPAAATLLFALHVHTPAVAETNLNGFISLFAGRVTTGTEFLADYPKTGIYGNDWSMSPDSTLGVQFSSFFNDDLSLVTQVVINSASDCCVDVDWFYFNYHLSPELSVQIGRKRLPFYYYSDYFDVGYAYYWIRPPADLYTWQINNYNGISLLYEFSLSNWDSRINLYYGNEESNDNELLGLLFSVPVDERWKDMIGIVAAISNEWADISASYMHGLVDRNINGISVLNDSEQHFFGLSINFNFNELQILTEFNNYQRPASQIRIDTSMLSLGYQIGDYTPHITRASFEQEINASGNDEKHHTTSVGIRWDFDTNMAFKIQYDKVEDEGLNVPVKGNSKSLSLGLDLVF